MNHFSRNLLFILTLFLWTGGCVTPFIPETIENKELLVVEGLLTDQLQTYYVKLSKSQPIGSQYVKEPVRGCQVSISDDFGQVFNLKEISAGTYISDSTICKGIIGRKYTLHISTNDSFNNLEFESLPMELKAVPGIDSLFYEKITIKEADERSQADEGCQIFVNTHDSENDCRFYRWTFSETWEFRLPYDVPNNRCWLYALSDKIHIKSTNVLAEDKINHYPLYYISNKTDRLREKYSILVTQYSLNEGEFKYWERLQNITENVGGLYDITPTNVPGNIFCLSDPDYEVLGYFSVSATTSKRIFIEDTFSGIIDMYYSCIADTIYPPNKINGLGFFTWILITNDEPLYRVITHDKRCVDCTLRGTNIEPLFWNDDAK